ncbi:chromodomain-helicase-DNA-binding protein 1 [Ditylenchus destructor]|uniref:Chromodomain-helicase-DNA-binding protein 1 n=1 Tax=Ditylenchus destructor TaxID=166010 RepID=A0AAD4R7I0_9BILA|nr:chromodomain-helicase-DNA-binding protein 1 [Ditylenchus destructor]
MFHIHELYGPFLVVVPLSTMAAWQREFELWAPQLNTVVYMGDVNSREQIRQYELSVAGSNRKLRANVVITTYEIVLKDKAFLGHYDWAVLAVDEAHRLKNDESLLYQSLSSFSTNHRLLITGTPLQNSLKELWALLRFIMPERFNDWYEFERAHQDRDHKGISSLHKKLEPFLLRRVKKDVEKSLPAKVEQILRVDMTTQQKQFYKLILTRNYDELSKGVKGSISGFINVMMELKKCCNHCCLVRNDDQMEQEAQARLQQLLKSSGKLILLDKLLCRLKETGHRVLIFSQMVIMLDVLQEYMSLRRFATQRLDGSMRSDLRKQALDHFNAPGSTDFCFLLSTRAGGLGINLATADTVIIFDSDWNPQNDLQAMSRAHRIGQKNQVNIYRLVTKGSVEEEIVERAKKKLVLDHLVIQRMDTTGKTVLAKNAAMNQTSKVPFDKADLTAILKFGAEELFKERLEGDVEPEVDVDDILRRAETRECDPEDNGNELLNSFKYANFAIDEEKDLTEAEEKDWKDIIPEDQLEAFKEEQRKKAEQEMFLEPRQRQKARETSADGSQDDSENGNTAGRKKTKKKRASDSDEEETRTGKRTYKKKVIFNFTEKEVRQFTKSFRKFTQPLNRLDAIAQDAELEEHSSAELAELVQEFLRQCQEATVKYESEKLNSENGKSPEDNSIALVKRKHDRGPTFKVGQVDVYVRPIMKMQSDLEPLHKAMEEFKAQLSSTFKIPGKPKRPLGWDVDWAEEDDISLLKGIYQYGMGSWEAIKMDPEFGLADKIWVKNKVKKPQPKHLQSRADCLLKLLAKAYRSSASPPKKRLKGRNESEHGIRSLKDTSLIKKKKSEPNKNSKDKLRTKSSDKHRLKHSDNGGESTEAGAHERGSPSPSKKWRSEDLSQVAALKLNLPRYKNGLKDRTSDEFVKCVDLMRPVHKAIKKMNSEPAHSVLWLKYLTKLGDHITGCVIKLIKEKEAHSSQEEWYNFLWIFLSMFLEADSDPIKLLTTYKHCVKTREKEGSHHHHHSHNSSSHHHNHYDHKSDHPRKTL